MNRKRASLIVAGFLAAILGIGVIVWWPAPPTRWVGIALKPPSVSAGSPSIADFIVTNGGARPVTLAIFIRDLRTRRRFDLNGMNAWPVNAFTNRALSLRGLSPTEPWRICADVFEPAGPFAKGAFAARRLWAFLRGKSPFSGIWSWNRIPATYEVNGPELPGIPLRVVSAPPRNQRHAPAENWFWSVDGDPLTNTAAGIWVSPPHSPPQRVNRED